MQSILLAGRWLGRALVNSLSTEMHTRPNVPSSSPCDLSLQFVTASYGLGCKTKDLRWPIAPDPLRANLKSACAFGDDSYFIARHPAADVIGVADGVGGWRNYGIDPSHFSRSLMTTCQQLVQQGRFTPHNPVDTLLKQSYEELSNQKLHLIGSSTACIVSLYRQTRTIHTCNLGDSGFLVVRDGQVVHRSAEQQHYFNTPFQLAVVPPGQRGQVISDSVEQASSTTFAVEDGDVILVGTDGLFDNLFEERILKHLERSCLADSSMFSIAQDLVQDAAELSVQQGYVSPFSVNARHHGFDYTGGKPDDITVVLARVTQCYHDELAPS